MLLIKITILLMFFGFFWTLYVDSKFKSDAKFNLDISNDNYPNWYLVYGVFMLLLIILMFISLVYFLFFVWK